MILVVRVVPTPTLGRRGSEASLPNCMGGCMLSRRPNAGTPGRQRDWHLATNQALVAQLDRAPDFEFGGREFESLRARHPHAQDRVCASPKRCRAAPRLQNTPAAFGNRRAGTPCRGPPLSDRPGPLRRRHRHAEHGLCLCGAIPSRARAHRQSRREQGSKCARRVGRAHRRRCRQGEDRQPAVPGFSEPAAGCATFIVHCGRYWRRISCAMSAIASRWSLPRPCIRPRTPANCSRSDYRGLPAVTLLDVASRRRAESMAGGGQQCRAFNWSGATAHAVDQVFASAAHVTKLSLHYPRVTANTMEPRAVDRLSRSRPMAVIRFARATQTPFRLRDTLASILGHGGARPARDLARCRRWLRHEEPVLSGGGSCALGGPQACTSGQMDRGAQRCDRVRCAWPSSDRGGRACPRRRGPHLGAAQRRSRSISAPISAPAPAVRPTTR